MVFGASVSAFFVASVLLLNASSVSAAWVEDDAYLVNVGKSGPNNPDYIVTYGAVTVETDEDIQMEDGFAVATMSASCAISGPDYSYYAEAWSGGERQQEYVWDTNPPNTSHDIKVDETWICVLSHAGAYFGSEDKFVSFSDSPTITYTLPNTVSSYTLFGSVGTFGFIMRDSSEGNNPQYSFSTSGAHAERYWHAYSP